MLRTPRLIPALVVVCALSLGLPLTAAAPTARPEEVGLSSARLNRIGQQSYIDHDQLFRVRIGPFATRDLAVKARASLESSGMSAIILAE